MKMLSVYNLIEVHIVIGITRCFGLMVLVCRTRHRRGEGGVVTSWRRPSRDVIMNEITSTFGPLPPDISALNGPRLLPLF